MGKLLDLNSARGEDRRFWSDGQLVSQYQLNGDQNCIVILMERYARPITAIAFRFFRDEEAVKDLSADLFLKLSDKLKVLDVEKLSNFKSWLLTVVRNTILDIIRKNQTRKQHYTGFGEKQKRVVNNEIAQIRKMDHHHLYEAISDLPENEKYCVEDMFLEGLTYKEVMQKYDWTFNQARGYRDRAIKRLKGKLGNYFENYLEDF